jgi:hypothetical protein
MSYEFDPNESWLPECRSPYGYPAPIREPQALEPVDRPPVQREALYDFDGHLSPSATINPAPRQSIPLWDESTRELRIVLHRHPVSPAFLRSSFNEAKKNRGQIKTVAVFVMHGLGDSQSIRVLQSMGGFTKDETRNAGRGVCYVRSMKNPEPKPEVTEPKPEPKELGWLEQELKQTVDSLEALKQMGVHKSFLITLEAQAADLQKQVDNQNSVKDTDEWKELDRQEREIQKQIDAISRGQS